MTQTIASLPTSPQILEEYLRSHGKRCTPERFMILDSAQGMTGHFTAESLCERLLSEGKRVAVATVYSTLQLLVDCGLVRRLRINDGQATLYETAQGNHLHLICNRCGKIKDVRDTVLAELLSNRRFTAFTPTGYCLSVYGVCSACARKGRKGSSQAKKQCKNTLSDIKK